MVDHERALLARGGNLPAEIHCLADLERSTAGDERMLRDELDRRVEIGSSHQRVAPDRAACRPVFGPCRRDGLRSGERRAGIDHRVADRCHPCPECRLYLLPGLWRRWGCRWRSALAVVSDEVCGHLVPPSCARGKDTHDLVGAPGYAVESIGQNSCPIVHSLDTLVSTRADAISDALRSLSVQ